MHIWTDILIRELAMLAVLFALGSAPAAYLGRRFDAAARLALAPVLGLCVGTCVFTTLIWFTAARRTYWLVPVLAAISLSLRAPSQSSHTRVARASRQCARWLRSS